MTQEIATARVTLQRKRSPQTLPGHLWLYAGEIDDVKGMPEAGDLVDVYTNAGRFYGRGLFNPHSKIRVRLLTFEEEPIDETFWATRLKTADELRRRVVSGTDAYRLIHGEGDLLPGLVVDCYANLLVMQTLSFGMDRRKELLADLLGQQIKPDAIYLRNDAKSRTLEGLPISQGFLRGQSPTRLEITEGPARFEVDVERGQKTGWFCDQRENRLAAAPVAKGAAVLEIFCHTGAFGIHAALQGATSVLGVDVSTDALAMARRHADMNGVSGLCEYREADAFEDLRALERAGHRYDLVILDPPAFARSKLAVPHALAGYKDINLQALRLIRPEGFLATCSCSYQVSEQSLWQTILEAARDAKRQLKLVESRSQSRDHPMLAAMPETRYLKCFIFQVC
jgi:23S rRNA (cytosine1962-C5)-methyltransferase